MAFAAATPIINPAAVILSLALLGPRITVAYVILGLVLPMLLGMIADRWGEPPEPQAVADTSGCCSSTRATGSATGPAPVAAPLPRRIAAGLRWGFTDLGPTIAFYMTIGVLLAGLIAVFLPAAWVESYLRENSAITLLAAGILGASIYVCAVAHIPLVATLLAAGAAPGVSIVFLVTGTATNLPELIALYHTIGRRTVLLYASSLIVGAMIAGTVVNLWLMPSFEPLFDPVRSLDLLDAGEQLQPTFSGPVSAVATAILVALAAGGIWRRVMARLRRGSGSDDGCCSG
jgi:hypothetical protein